MSIQQFSEQQYFIDLRSDSQEVNLGSFTQDRTTKIAHIRLFLYLKGTFTDEIIYLHLKDDPNTPVFETVTGISVVNVPDVTTDWLGWVRFDFDKEFIVGGTEYFLTAQTGNYTESASKYMGVAFDYPNIQNEQTGGSSYKNYCSKFQLYGLE